MPDDRPDVEKRTFKGMVGWLGLSVVVLVIDQLTKWLVVQNLRLGERVDVLPFFSWVRWHNDGAAFSMLSGGSGRWFFVLLALGFTIFIIYELRRLPIDSRLMGWAYALILGGALGNGSDRLLSGYVVDFALAHYEGWYFPAFNVADSALTVGAILWIGSMLLEYLGSRGTRAIE
jgi:signal peptidase II